MVLGVGAFYKYLGHRENGKDVMERHEAYVEDIHVETVTKYGKVYWNTIDSELEYAKKKISELGYTEKETLRDVLIRADRCLSDYGYARK